MHHGREGSESQIVGFNLLHPSIVKQKLLHLGFVVLIQNTTAVMHHLQLLHGRGAQSWRLSLELPPLDQEPEVNENLLLWRQEGIVFHPHSVLVRLQEDKDLVAVLFDIRVPNELATKNIFPICVKPIYLYRLASKQHAPQLHVGILHESHLFGLALQNVGDRRASRG